MKTITVFYDHSAYTLTWLRALVWAEKEFMDAGYKIVWDYLKAPIPKMDKIVPSPNKKEDFIKLFTKKHYDIVFLAYHHSREGLCSLSKEDRACVMQLLKNNSNKVIWLDTADGTGTCMFDVMPYVDLYMKKQILKDKSRYCEPIWSHRIFGEYYHNIFGIEETGQRDDAGYTILDKKFLNKLGISWNVGLGDLYTKGYKRWIYRNKYAQLEFSEPTLDSKYDVHYRGSGYPGAIGFQRTRTKELLEKREDIVKPDINSRVPYDEYVRESIDSLTLISPFGWGEICGRDFEAFVFGDALIKYDMSHLETYPDCYIKNQTYISLDWDFGNFDAILDKLKTEEGKSWALSIAINGQNLYKDYLCNKKMEFAEHIIEQIEKC